MPAEALRDSVAGGHSSLVATLLHVLDSEYGWRTLAEKGRETPLLTKREIPDLPAMVARFGAEAAAMREDLASLSDEAATQPMRYTIGDEPGTQIRWHALFHVVNHGTYHRGEAAAVLTALGQSLGELDFTIYLGRPQPGVT